ncbi:MAG: diguanylate cyclase [Methylomonas sp.]|jgi:diguanylate cyclase (GGDEF)-like protein/PAS domain S-box-containing protein|uniref:sensor domain-containing diguanylate cyclase n=1 Tax=Methylomonas sp. TaxID=418 RepID=UPI0025FB1C3E|nr:sensor domain-containing diguanylate cyclase [Methylomonas sp.]MCK9608241.1 diguanylate cyclase [Methylomonas sp.]
MSAHDRIGNRYLKGFIRSIKKFTLIFLGFTVGWFLVTQLLLAQLISDVPSSWQWFNVAKDVGFIVLGSGLSFGLFRRCLTKHIKNIAELEQNEESLLCVLAGSQLGFWDWDLLTGEVNRNAIWAEMLGYSLDDIAFTIQQWSDFVHPDDRAAAWESIHAVLEGRADQHQMIYRMKTRQGEYKWILDCARVIRRDEHGKALRMSGTHSDVSRLKLTEDALKISEERFRRIFETTGVGMSQVGLDGRFLLVNDTFCHITGYSRDELLNQKKNFQAITYPDDLPMQLQLMNRFCQGEINRYDLEKRYVRKDGTIAWVKLSIALLRDTTETPLSLITAVQDITRLKGLQHELELRAHIDYLTEIPNRRYFMQLAEHELARAQRYGNDVAIFMLDVDFFKRINDAHGHKAGDKVLQKIARIMQGMLREVDILGRIGGEEFAIVLPQTNRRMAMEVAERLRRQVADSVMTLDNGVSLNVTLSIGVAMMTRQHGNLDSVIGQADKGLYQAKAGGRNKVMFSD